MASDSVQEGQNTLPTLQFRVAVCHGALVCDRSTIRDAYLAHAAELATGHADGRRLTHDVERFGAEMPVALTRRRALTVELRQALERQNGTAGAKADEPAKGEEVLHGARPREAEQPRIDLPPGEPRRGR